MSTPPPSTMDIMIQITRLEGKLDAYISTLPKDVEDHEERLRVVEKRIWSIPTATGLVNFLMMLAGYLVFLVN